MTEEHPGPYTAVYMDTDGKIKEKKFVAIESARAFFRELAKKDLPTVVPEGASKKPKSRIEEIDSLLSELYRALGGEVRSAVSEIVRLEAERAIWKVQRK